MISKYLRFINPRSSVGKKEEKRHQEALKLLDFMYFTAHENAIVKTKKEFADKYLIPIIEEDCENLQSRLP